MRKLAVLLMLLTALLGTALAEEPEVLRASGEEGAFPELNEQGFLDEGEYVYQNPEEGVWRYASQTLRIEIYRYQIAEPKDKRAIWYEAEVWATEDNAWRLFSNTEGKHMTSQTWPYIIARKNQTVLALNTDFAQMRYNAKKTTGIVIRDGKVFSKKTLKQGVKQFPNLDVLALYPDGNMEVYYSNEKTADEYLEMGVQSTLAFGPWLIRDGVLNEEGLAKYGNSTRAPRTAIGMVEKGHYFAMMLEGRHTGSKGGTIAFLAEKMMDRGCTLAFNLDGGETATILFMGEQICTVGGSATGNARRTPEIFGIGQSSLVPVWDQ